MNMIAHVEIRTNVLTMMSYNIETDKDYFSKMKYFLY